MKKLLTISIMAMAVAAALLSFAADADDCAAKATSQARLPVVAIPDYLSTNGMVLAKRSLTEAILKAGCLPVVLPEMDDAAADQFLAGCDALVIGGGIGNHNYARRVKYEDRVISLCVHADHMQGILSDVRHENKIVCCAVRSSSAWLFYVPT